MTTHGINSSNLHQDKVTTQGWSDFVDDIGNTSSDVWDEIEKTGEDALKTIERCCSIVRRNNAYPLVKQLKAALQKFLDWAKY